MGGYNVANNISTMVEEKMKNELDIYLNELLENYSK